MTTEKAIRKLSSEYMSSKALMHLKELITKKTPLLNVMISNMQITKKFRQTKVCRDQKFAK